MATRSGCIARSASQAVYSLMRRSRHRPLCLLMLQQAVVQQGRFVVFNFDGSRGVLRFTHDHRQHGILFHSPASIDCAKRVSVKMRSQTFERNSIMTHSGTQMLNQQGYWSAKSKKRKQGSWKSNGWKALEPVGWIR